MYNLLKDILSVNQIAMIGTLAAFLLTFLALRYPLPFLPTDQGRAFAVNGGLSKGKIRGVGLTFVCVFIVCSLLFLPISREYVIYCILLFAMMLSGYLDDAAETPWNDYKKGAIDLVLSLMTMWTVVANNSTTIQLLGMQIEIPLPVYFILGVILLWVSVNVTNCSDGVDGLCASLCCVVLGGFTVLFSEELGQYGIANLIFISVLLAYLYFNSKPSSMLMGDAGSRALGFYIAVIAMKTGHPFAYLLLALVVIVDGGIGLVKIFLKRFFKISILKNTLTPLHDHVRKNKDWSDTQVVFRFSIYQILLVAVAAILLFTGCSGEEVGKEAGQITESTKENMEAAPAPMREISSMELVQDMTLGWNLGDTMDVCNADRDGDGQIDENAGQVDETLWGNVKTTPEIFSALKEQGINAVRIPVTWRDHLGEAPDYKIDKEWMERVQEVVDYAYDQGMYVIINVHHDGGGDPDFGAWIRNASTEKEDVLEKYQAVWQQIADRFQNYSDYLIFESMNEVGFDDLDSDAAFSLLNEMNQKFVELIRSSGGNNPKRHLLIAGYWTDIEKTCEEGYRMPSDPADRCIVSLHYYTPWQFCTTNGQDTWGSKDDVKEMKEKIAMMKEHFIDKKIPVIIGEFGVYKGNEKESRLKFCSEFVKRCKAAGIPCYFWDNGSEFDRTSCQWRTEGLLEAMQAAAGIDVDDN